MRYLGPKTKRARRLREALREKDVKYLVKRNYPPGMHGQSRRRITEYGFQLLEKQKAKWTYNLTEKQFRKYYDQAERSQGLTPQQLIEALELRLDNVVFRLGFAASRPQARQLVSHRFVSVNGGRVNIPSYAVSVGDEIAIQEGKKSSKYILQLLPHIKEAKPQEWLSLDARALSGKVMSKPTLQNTGTTIRMQLISEYYSR